jgi:hypothetical protein
MGRLNILDLAFFLKGHADAMSVRHRKSTSGSLCRKPGFPVTFLGSS